MSTSVRYAYLFELALAKCTQIKHRYYQRISSWMINSLRCCMKIILCASVQQLQDSPCANRVNLYNRKLSRPLFYLSELCASCTQISLAKLFCRYSSSRNTQNIGVPQQHSIVYGSLEHTFCAQCVINNTVHNLQRKYMSDHVAYFIYLWVRFLSIYYDAKYPNTMLNG